MASNQANNSQQRMQSVASMIDEMRCDDQKKRIAAITNLSTIATTLGPDRTRSELLPYCLEVILDDDEETLLILADSVGNLLREVGGVTQVQSLINVLEKLCQIEEPAVRDKAASKIKDLLKQIKVRDHERPIMQMITRLAKGEEVITSKLAAVTLVPAVFAQVQAPNQQELVEMFQTFSQDEMPQVRKQCAIALSDLISVMPKASTPANSEQELFNIFARFQSDEQDSVRMQCIESCVRFMKTLPIDKATTFLIPCIKKFTEDKSWRIRYLIADRIMDLTVIGPDQARVHLMPAFVSFLKDTESEVRTAANSRLAEFCKFINDSELVIKQVLPCLKELQTDNFNYVKCALAENLLALCPIVGRSVTNDQILPVFLSLIRDENSEVRLNLFKRLDDLHSVVNIEELQTSIIPSLEELAREKNWRTKQSVIEQFPSLATQLGEKFFTDKLLPIAIEWLKDSIYTIRVSTLEMMKKVAATFGSDWSSKNLLGPLLEQHKETSYMRRLTALFGIQEMYDKQAFDVFKQKIWPVIQTLGKDPVANVRMNVAKTVEKLIPFIKSQGVGAKEILEQMRAMLRQLSSDSDTDVRYYAGKAQKKDS